MVRRAAPNAQVLGTVERTREKGTSVRFISYDGQAFQVAGHFVVLPQRRSRERYPEKTGGF